MGCDIHCFIERKHKFGHWELWGQPVYDDRDYYLFAVLAGVRNSWDLKPITPPRGLPTDLSWETKDEAERQQGDAHTHSWLTLEEILSFDWEKWSESRRSGSYPLYPKSRFVTETIPILRMLGKPDEIRIVFWFDN